MKTKRNRGLTAQIADREDLPRSIHIVLIPGFVGFDALGQLEYYARVTPVFRQWLVDHQLSNVVLHYFDNFPTASVGTRAKRLLAYLLKRFARGEFSPEDNIVLVGHSTGGLDIRRLLWNLMEDLDKKLPVDGIAADDLDVPTAADIASLIKRVVFLSVPQYGTNIANWVRDWWLVRKGVVDGLRLSLGGSQVPILDIIEYGVSELAAIGTNLDVALAVRDALAEAEPVWCKTPMLTAQAQEAASKLGLWLRHIASDFTVINDLSAIKESALQNNDGKDIDDEVSPAHFSPSRRLQEQLNWQKFGIKTQSYATIAQPPPGFDHNDPIALDDLLKAWTYPQQIWQALTSSTDIVYRTCYRACASGPFEDPTTKPLPRLLWGSSLPHQIRDWENDGVVNTASMLWPNEEETYLLECDHMDIVGHFDRFKSSKDSVRLYDAYDLLNSASGFNQASFELLWNHVFTFCATPETVAEVVGQRMSKG